MKNLIQIPSYVTRFLLLIGLVSVMSCSEKETVELNTSPIPRIIELLPANATAGEEISIVGANFSKETNGNEIKFNQLVVEPISISDTLIKVKLPEMAGNTVDTVGISVRSNGKISNKRNLALVRIKTFQDNFDRPEQAVVDASVIPNPIGTNWQTIMGNFGLKTEQMYSNVAGLESYILYRDPELNLNVGEGSYFKLSADINVSAGSFGGIIFNVQSDNKRFYLLRFDGDQVQLLKTGNSGLGDWDSIMMSDSFSEMSSGVTYHVEITSSSPGKIIVKLTNPATKEIFVDKDFDDSAPYLGGSPGFYYFGLSDPFNIYFDNFKVETM